MGFCCGIEPEDGKVFSPVDGVVSQVPDTLHAVGIESQGMELLVHCGVDTVDMKGQGFTMLVKERGGDKSPPHGRIYLREEPAPIFGATDLQHFLQLVVHKLNLRADDDLAGVLAGTDHAGRARGLDNEDEDAEAEEAKIVLSNNDFTAIATGVLAAIGGKENVSNVERRTRRAR